MKLKYLPIYDNEPLFMVAVMNGNVEIVKECLMDPTTDVNYANKSGETPLIYATLMDDIEIVKELLKCPKIDVNKKSTYNTTAVQNACDYSFIEILKELLMFPDTNIYIPGVLYDTYNLGKCEIIKLIKKRMVRDLNFLWPLLSRDIVRHIIMNY